MSSTSPASSAGPDPPPLPGPDGPAGRATRRGPGVVDVEDQRHRRAEVGGQRGLHRRQVLDALVPVCRVGQRKMRTLRVDGHETPAGVPSFRPRREGPQDPVAPGLRRGGRGRPRSTQGSGRGSAAGAWEWESAPIRGRRERRPSACCVAPHRGRDDVPRPPGGAGWSLRGAGGAGAAVAADGAPVPGTSAGTRVAGRRTHQRTSAPGRSPDRTAPPSPSRGRAVRRARCRSRAPPARREPRACRPVRGRGSPCCAPLGPTPSTPRARRTARATVPTPRTARAPARRGRPGAGRR